MRYYYHPHSVDKKTEENWGTGEWSDLHKVTQQVNAEPQEEPGLPDSGVQSQPLQCKSSLRHWVSAFLILKWKRYKKIKRTPNYTVLCNNEQSTWWHLVSLILFWLITQADYWLVFVTRSCGEKKKKAITKATIFPPLWKGGVSTFLEKVKQSHYSQECRSQELGSPNRGGRLHYFVNSQRMKDINNTICGELIICCILHYYLYMLLSNLIFATLWVSTIQMRNQTQRG